MEGRTVINLGAIEQRKGQGREDELSMRQEQLGWVDALIPKKKMETKGDSRGKGPYYLAGRNALK